MNTEYGHPPGEKEPELVLGDPLLREQAIRTTVQLVVGERCALSASSGLVNAAPDEGSKRFLATQTLDEARHVEVFTQRLYDLGVRKADLESTIRSHANPNLVKFAELLLEKVDRKDFVAGVVGQNIVLEGMAFHVFELLQAGSQAINPKFAHTLSGTIADERRHVGFGENRIGSLIREQPAPQERRRAHAEGDVLLHARDVRGFVPRASGAGGDGALASRSGRRAPESGMAGRESPELEPQEMEAVLADSVLAEFKLRLGRIGLEYQSPARP